MNATSQPQDPQDHSALTPFEEHQEITIQRARPFAPNDARLIESSGDTNTRDEAFAFACELLGEAS